MITYQTQTVKRPDIKRREISQWIRAVVELHGKTTGDIAYIFCSDEDILRINREYLHHDYYTDIITFDYSEDSRIAGDIFISLETVRSNAEQFEQSFYRELFRVMIHGILHLCGQKDKSPADRAEMTLKENHALNQLRMES